MTDQFPLISCVMPTYGRPDYVDEAVAMFLDQDYPAKELIVLNDCPGQVFHSDRDDVRVVNMETRFPTVGEKRNASIELARGDFIAVWDDDDAFLPWRLSYSLAALQRWQTQFYRPESFLYYTGGDGLLDVCCDRAHLSPLHSSTLFRKDLWKEVGGYPARNVAHDAPFCAKIHDYLGVTYISYPIDGVDRFYIMRGKSHYRHLSMRGGAYPLDTLPGDFPIVPRPIADPVLRRLFRRHLEAKQEHLGGNCILP